MIKYTTSDIIRRAEQIADLENSDFISADEKCALLNESWTQLYSKITGANDKAWIKSVVAYDGMKLPSDFFLLSALYVQSSKAQIFKRSASEENGYEIRNGYLILSRGYDDIIVTMEYYPVPQTLFFNDNKKHQTTYPITPKVIIDDDYIIGENSNGVTQIMDINTGLPYSQEYTLTGIVCKNGYISVSGNIKTFYSHGSSTAVTSKEMPFVIKGNEVTFDNVDTVASVDLSAIAAVIVDHTQQNLFYLKTTSTSGTFSILNKDMVDTGETITADSLFFCREDGLYVSEFKSNKITRINNDNVETFSLSMRAFCCFEDMHKIVTLQGDYLYTQSYGPDTLLEYPNNTYYTLLAYALAISFKMKQNGDPSLINAKYNEALTQFFETLTEDSNDVVQIKNMYSSRRLIW